MSRYGAILFCLLLGVVAPQVVRATFTVAVDRPSRIVVASGYTTFSVYITNTSSATKPFRVVRVVNDRPDTSWHVSICSPEHCYDEEVDSLEVQSLAPQGIGGASVHVQAGAEGTGRVVLQVDSGPGGETQTVELSVTVGEPPAPAMTVNIASTSVYGRPGDSVEMFAVVTNTSTAPLDLRMRRLEEDFPDTTWRSRICTLFDCFAEDITVTPSIALEPGGSTGFTIKVFAGHELYSQGQVEAVFEAGEETAPVYVRFLVTVSPASAVPSPSFVSGTTGVYPNPTDGPTRIVLPAAAVTRSYTVELRDVVGRRVEPRSLRVEHGTNGEVVVDLDLRSLAPGTYFYSVIVGPDPVVGTIVIVR